MFRLGKHDNLENVKPRPIKVRLEFLNYGLGTECNTD